MSDDTATPKDAQGTMPDEPRHEPPPQEPWAARFGLVRPRQGRFLAGVCTAIGRATNTDPLLWRVLIGVLAFFGVGIVIYLAGWLLIPGEGDTASPIEALFGRGRSSTSAVLTLVLGVLTVVLLGALTESWVVAIIAAVALAVAALAINPRQGPPAPAAPPPPPNPYAPLPNPYVPVTGAVPPPGSYQPPFAPHGPYTPPPPPVPPMPPKPKPEPSRLGRLIFGIVLVVIGTMGLADMAGVSVPAGAYVAAALGVVGLGLLLGAWYGRARGFIVLGLLLSLLLPIIGSADKVERTRAGSVRWNPSTIDQVASEYTHQFGEARLDLSEVDFSNRDVEIIADISFGDMRIILPPNVDTTMVSNVSFSDVVVFDRENNGVGVDNQQTDLGEDGEGGGKLLITLNVKFGHAEVTR